jgi:uncharacterized protein (DUF2062 family)
MRDSFWQRRLIQPLTDLLTQGITREKIAWSLALGIVLGVFPVLGSTTVLCALAAALLGLNLPAIQLVNFLVYPLQFALIVPFMRLGERMFRAQPLPLSLAQMLALERASLPHAVAVLWVSALRAVSAWLLVSPVLVAILYFVALRLLRTLALVTSPQPNEGA